MGNPAGPGGWDRCGSGVLAPPSPHFSPSTCCGTVGRALDCVRVTNPILNVQEHASGRIGASSLPGHDLRHLAGGVCEKCGLEPRGRAHGRRGDRLFRFFRFCRRGRRR